VIQYFLEVILNEGNNNQIDLQERIKNANRTYFMLHFFLNKNISKKLKSRLKNTTIDKTLTNASETGTLTDKDREEFNIFERKVYRRISGPVYDIEKENWKILTNKEIYARVKKKTYCNRDNKFCISVINQPDAQNFCFTISLLHASTCFEHMCSSSGGQNCITQPPDDEHMCSKHVEV